MIAGSGGAMESNRDEVAQWLHRLAPGWQLIRAKYLMREIDVRSESGDEELLSLTKGGVVPRSDIGDALGRADSLIGYKMVKSGDLVMNKMQAWHGMFGLSPYDGIVSPDYAVFRVRSPIDARWLTYLLRSSFYSGQFLWRSRGMGTAFLRLHPDNLLDTPIVTPPTPVQAALADLLDSETARIDSLIALKRRMIDLLEERLQAFVSTSIAGDAAQRDSGIPWMGRIPDHWNVQPVWQLFRLGRGRVMSHDDIANNPGDYPVYSSQTANDGVMGTIGTFDFDGSYLTWTTDGAKAGTVFARTGRFSCTNVCGTLKPRSQCDLGFFEFVLNRATHWYVRHDINPKLMNEVMASIRVPVPPMDEQIRIGGLLRGIYDHWQSVLKVMGESISLLDERRQAVLTAAVTGDIEILGAAV